MMSVPIVEQAKAQSATTSATSTKFNIPAQSLSTALIAFSRQTKLGIFVTSSLALGKKSTAVNGALSPEVALQRLLSGTGLTYTFTNQNTVRIMPPPPRHRMAP
ncbi:STN domain-containing protein [Ochrobactrum teleogrylli]|nr:STN domain-containing protein [[Ochrobactrum] teleogrylli]